jgi:hypothetical protein
VLFVLQNPEINHAKEGSNLVIMVKLTIVY